MNYGAQHAPQPRQGDRFAPAPLIPVAQQNVIECERPRQPGLATDNWVLADGGEDRFKSWTTNTKQDLRGYEVPSSISNDGGFPVKSEKGHGPEP